jgi:hypothetical protein
MFRRYLALLVAVFGLVAVFATPALAAAPTVTTGEAKEVKRATAVLKEGTVNPEGSPSTYYFEYGPEACDISASTCGIKTQTIGPLTEPVTAEPVKLQRLKPGTTYHFWIVAGNAEGTTHGTEATFSTSTAEPKEYVFEKDLAGYTFVSPLGVGVNQVTGDVYVSDKGASPPAIEQFNAAGVWQSGTEMPSGSGGATFQLAVDNAGGAEQGDVYITDITDSAVYKFDRAGASDPSDEGALIPDPTTPTIGKEVVSEPRGVAVNSHGNVYITSASGVVSEFSSTGAMLNAALIAGPVEPGALGIDGADNIYVVGETETVEYTSTGTCVDLCKPIIEGEGAGIALDSASDVFVSDHTTEVVDEYGPSEGHPLIQNPALEVPGDFVEFPRGLAVNNASHTLYVAERGDAVSPVVKVFRFLNAAPVGVKTEPATPVSGPVEALNATINPGGVEPAEYYFEYGTSPCNTAAETCGTVATEPSQLPLQGEAAIPVTVRLDNLTPNTTYHYWVVGANEESGVDHGEEQTFTTGPAEPPQPAAPAIATPPRPAPPAAGLIYPTLTAITPVPVPKTSAKPRSTPKPKACKKGFVRKKRRCVRRPRPRTRAMK